MLKYIEQLEKMDISYAVFDYIKSKNEYIRKFAYEGKAIIEDTNKLNCKECSYYKSNIASKNIDIFELIKMKKEMQPNENEENK